MNAEDITPKFSEDEAESAISKDGWKEAVQVAEELEKSQSSTKPKASEEKVGTFEKLHASHKATQDPRVPRTHKDIKDELIKQMGAEKIEGKSNFHLPHHLYFSCHSL